MTIVCDSNLHNLSTRKLTDRTGGSSMNVSKRKLGVVLVALFAVSAFATGDNLRPRIVRWTPPATFSSHSPGRIHALSGEIGSGPFPFFPVTPCRQYDSRNSTP